MRIHRNWAPVGLYSIGIFAAAPFLPGLVRSAAARWSNSYVSQFVLYVEISIGIGILALGARLLLSAKNKKKAIIFLISVGAILFSGFILYRFLFNPYEITHFPEYGVLGILVMRALSPAKDSQAIKEKKTIIIQNSYFYGGLITGIIGTVEEIYQHFLPNRFFNWYDILLNVVGGVLGLLIFWAMENKSSANS